MDMLTRPGSLLSRHCLGVLNHFPRDWPRSKPKRAESGAISTRPERWSSHQCLQLATPSRLGGQRSKPKWTANGVISIGPASSSPRHSLKKSAALSMGWQWSLLRQNENRLSFIRDVVWEDPARHAPRNGA